MRKMLLLGAFAAVSVYALAATAYGFHARDSAIRGWAAANTRSPDGVEHGEIPKELILRLAGLQPQANDASKINLALRDYVYRANSVGPNGPGSASPKSIFTHLGVAGWDELCGGMSVALSWALNKVGIEARVVQLATEDFVDGRDMYDTHVTVEAMIDGKWRITDPTFNVAVSCSDGQEFLSVAEAKSCVEKGKKLVFIPGNTQLKSRTVESYYAPYRDFLFAYKVASVEVPDGWYASAIAHYPELQ